MLKAARLAALLLVVPSALIAQDAGPTADPVRTLVVILDAVPFDSVKGLVASRSGGEPLFEGFYPPQPLISSFPSSTSVAMVGLLEPFELPRSPGYEARFFDWAKREVRGGGAISFFRIEFAWRDFFDWSRKGVVRSAFGGLRPVSASVTRVEKAVEAFFRSDASPYFVYLETTDLAAHMKGPQELDGVLEALDAALERQSRLNSDTTFRTVILSDHGVEGDGTRLINALPAVRQAARAGGFRLAPRLKRPGDVVLTPFGLVSSFEAYAGLDLIESVSTALVVAEGVDLCVYRSGDHMRVENRQGRARIGRQVGLEGVSWRYSVETGDPLGYGPVAGRLSERDAASEHLPDGWWLEATAVHDYPDAFHRITRAFDLVDNPASVLCSLEPGFMYGRTSTEWLARLSGSTVRWTHGALSRDATLGFLLTDDERFAARGALRFDSALAPLTLPRDAVPSLHVGVVAAESDTSQRDKMPEIN